MNDKSTQLLVSKPIDVQVRSTLAAGCLWITFGLGLLLQVFSARLEIAHNAFVMPHDRAMVNGEMNPAEIVGRERRLQTASGSLVLIGVFGLAIFYRNDLMNTKRGKQQ